MLMKENFLLWLVEMLVMSWEFIGIFKFERSIVKSDYSITVAVLLRTATARGYSNDMVFVVKTHPVECLILLFEI